MKAILISVKPRFVAKILNGEKTIEVRKNKSLKSAIQKLINEYGFAWVYAYCSKNKPYTFESTWVAGDGRYSVREWQLDKAVKYVKSKKHYGKDKCEYSSLLYGTPYGNLIEERKYYNGKVAFKFKCYKVEDIKVWSCNNGSNHYYETETDSKTLLKKSCLSYLEMSNYLQGKNGYAIHISELDIFDEPKELKKFNHKVNVVIKTKNSLFETHYSNNIIDKPLTKAPQNFTCIEIGE